MDDNKYVIVVRCIHGFYTSDEFTIRQVAEELGEEYNEDSHRDIYNGITRLIRHIGDEESFTMKIDGIDTTFVVQNIINIAMTQVTEE